MSDLRKAAEQAIEALERIDEWFKVRHFVGLVPHEHQVLDDLRAALEEPEQEQSEPVYRCRRCGHIYQEAMSSCDCTVSSPPDMEEGVAVFPAPPRREPLNIQPPNAEGSTMCVVKWMAETPHGWVGSWDKAALEQFNGIGVKP